ncbi:hypothetical protein ACSMXM_05385 [Pacificimonas sp. ICDLI1SI03]
MTLTITRTDLPLPAEDTDYGFSVAESGRLWRVRIKTTPISTNAPVNGDPVVRPRGCGVTVSAALLDEAGEVAVSATGGLMIFEAHTRTFDLTDFKNPNFDMKKEVERLIYSQIEEAEKQADNDADIGAVLNGLEDIQPEAPPPPVLPVRWSALQFRSRFTMPERALIRASEDDVVQDFYDALDQAEFISPSDPMTVAGVQYIESVGLIDEGRAAEVLGNV